MTGCDLIEPMPFDTAENLESSTRPALPIHTAETVPLDACPAVSFPERLHDYRESRAVETRKRLA